QADDQGLDATDQEERERGYTVENADALVVDGREPRPDPSRLRVRELVVSQRVWDRHLLQPGQIRGDGLRLLFGEAEVGHLDAGFEALRVAHPGGDVVGRVRPHAGRQR